MGSIVVSTSYLQVSIDAMAPVPRHSSDDVLFAEASGWFARLHADDVTAEERRQFLLWCAQSADHARAWDEVQELFGDLHAPATTVHDRLKHCGEYPFTPDRMANTALPMSRRHRGKNLVCWAAVAVMIICLAVATLWGPSILQNLASDYRTGKGEQRQVTLADGSHIFLNTNSAISMNISDHQRRFTLLRGEAYFEIVADTGRPAVVISHRGETQVLGTAFNVAQQGEDTVVTVATGTVDVWHAAQWGNPIRVRGGQQVRYTPQRLSEVQSIDLTDALAWRRGQIIFGQKPLSEVIDEVNRYRSGRIVILNPSIRHRPVTGAFDIQRPDHVIDTLRLGLSFNATALTPYLILLH